MLDVYFPKTQELSHCTILQIVHITIDTNFHFILSLHMVILLLILPLIDNHYTYDFEMYILNRNGSHTGNIFTFDTFIGVAVDSTTVNTLTVQSSRLWDGMLVYMGVTLRLWFEHMLL